MGNGDRAAAKAHDLLFVIAHELLTVGVKLNGALLRVFGAQKTGYTAYVILKILLADGAASQKQLAWRLGRKSATLTEPVLRLMMLGFVQAGKPAHDRRIKLLRITSAGRDYLRCHPPRRVGESGWRACLVPVARNGQSDGHCSAG